MLIRLLFVLFALATLLAKIAAQPANDDCANPDTLMVFTDIPFTTIDATTDGPKHPEADCFADGNDSIYADIWYTFTAVADGGLEWTVCDMADFDTRMAVYATEDACLASPDNLVVCNDDVDECDDFTSALSFQGQEGQTYMFRLGSYTDADNPTTTGSGTLRLRILTGPSNDLCENAIPIELGSRIFTNNFSGTDGPDHLGNPCEGDGEIDLGADIWYTFLAPYTGTAIWSTCDLADYDTGLAVYAGTTCPPDTNDLLACNDDFEGCAGFSSQLNWDIVAGETYLLRLGGYQGATGSGSFSLFGIDTRTNEVAGLSLEAEIFPNPVGNFLNLQFSLPTPDHLEFGLYKLDGKLITSYQGQFYPAGDHQHILDISGLKAGMHVLGIRSEAGEQLLRFVKL